MKEQRILDLHYRRIRYSLRQTLVCYCLAFLLVFVGRDNFGDEGAKEIGFALQKNKTLITLNLGMLLFGIITTLHRGKQFWVRRSKRIRTCIAEEQDANYVKPRYCLELLLFITGGNYIGDEGANQRILDLHYRRIRNSLRQTQVFGLAFQKNKTLTTLNLGIQLFKLLLLFIGNNNIGDEGAKELGVTLQKNKTLTTLNLGMALFEILLRFIGGNDFGYEVAKEFGFALQKNKTLTTLNLGIPLVWHYYYSSQGGIILEMKEQRKLAWRCKKMRHQPRQISVYLLN
eukprot:TRINITY_DN1601_c0_g1_i4.p1 TRINITY_DN1601_c0_g1~~TRINITY_DN1601_c0_g1_i4.p1  ORF type:complete len:287 (+),score=-4.61 TRINITY_DN1601_c0_g1_i4:790-1650(+)